MPKELMRRTTPPGGVMNQEQVFVNRMRKSIYNAMSSSVLQGRSSIASKLGKSFGGRRDIYKDLGYPGLNELNIDNYLAQYARGDIAGRLIDAPVDGSWEQKPIVKEVDQDPTEKRLEETEFEKDWTALVKKFRIWNVLSRVDKLTGLGRFGVLFMGFSDVTVAADLRNEVSGEKLDLKFLQPYSEKNVEIHSWDNDLTSDRYGYPLLYKLTTADSTGTGATKELLVHHSRVLHIAEGLMESNIYGTPRLERGFNRLMNLELIVGGSAEMFWQGAFPGYAYIADAETDMTQVAADIEKEIDMFVHDFKRYMKLQGLTVEKLSGDVADPKGHVEVQIIMLSIAYGFPKRILEGSERGELASSQDEIHWNDKLNTRRVDHCEPVILRPLLDTLIKYGILTDPGEEGYTIVWPDLNSPTDKDKAEVAKSLSTAIKDYFVSPDASIALPFDAFLEEILNFDVDKVKRIMEKVETSLGGAIAREGNNNNGEED